jgi:hypothetical protein
LGRGDAYPRSFYIARFSLLIAHSAAKAAGRPALREDCLKNILVLLQKIKKTKSGWISFYSYFSFDPHGTIRADLKVSLLSNLPAMYDSIGTLSEKISRQDAKTLREEEEGLGYR